LRSLNFKVSKADPDSWMHPELQTGGTKYWWEYMFCYMHDTLCGSELPQNILDSILGSYAQGWKHKATPKLYLRADVKKWYIIDSDKLD
jgi:hypothetical protein